MTKNAENPMAVRPPEAAEASASSSNLTPQPNSPAHRWQFEPPPKFPPTWWPEHGVKGTFSLEQVSLSRGSLTPEGWVITWTFGPKQVCMLQGNWPDPFPTATDAVLWLRFQVMPELEADPASAAVAAELRRRIDNAPAGTDAADLLNELKPSLIREFPRIKITSMCTVHEWLSSWGTEAEFRRCYATDVISCKDGRWSMPSDMWDILVADLCDNEMEYLSVVNGDPVDLERLRTYLP